MTPNTHATLGAQPYIPVSSPSMSLSQRHCTDEAITAGEYMHMYFSCIFLDLLYCSYIIIFIDEYVSIERSTQYRCYAVCC